MGFTLRVRVTATNADGQSVKASNATAAVTVQAGPPNTAPPTITGSAVVGESLTANPGTWTGTGITFTYLWSRCDAAGTHPTRHRDRVLGSRHRADRADAGKTLRVKVTATNASGSNAVTLPAGAQRLSAHRPRQIDLPQLRPRARVRRPLPPALRRHQSDQGRQEYVDSIIDAVKWLGFDWGHEHLYFASATTSTSCTQFAEHLIKAGHAYVDSQTADEMREAARHAHRARDRTRPSATARPRRTSICSAG